MSIIYTEWGCEFVCVEGLAISSHNKQETQSKPFSPSVWFFTPRFFLVHLFPALCLLPACLNNSYTILEMRLALIIKLAVYFINSAKIKNKKTHECTVGDGFKSHRHLLLHPRPTSCFLSASNAVSRNKVAALERSWRSSTAFSSTSARDTRQSAFIAARRRGQAVLGVIKRWTNSNKSSSWKVSALIKKKDCKSESRVWRRWKTHSRLSPFSNNT